MQIDVMASRMKQYNVINMGVRVEIKYLDWRIVNVYKATITQVQSTFFIYRNALSVFSIMVSSLEQHDCRFNVTT